MYHESSMIYGKINKKNLGEMMCISVNLLIVKDYLLQVLYVYMCTLRERGK